MGITENLELQTSNFKSIVRIIKLGIISILAFAILITGISLFFPSHIRISKAIDIETSMDSLQQQVSDQSNWKNWYPGADTMQLVTNANEKSLRVNNVDGIIRIQTVTDSSITSETSGTGVRDMISGWNFFEGTRPNTITIQWYMDFHLRWYPWEKFSSILLEKRYGPTMERGLDSLKTFLEKQGER